MKVRAIYFDLDDTLCRYWDASKAALRASFEAEAPEGVTVEQMTAVWASEFKKFSPEVKTPEWYDTYLKHGGTTRLELMRRVLATLGHPDEERAAELSRLYGVMRDQNLELFHDALYVLDELKKSYPLGLITNGPADIQREEIATLNLTHYFDHVFIEGEVGFGKPIQEVFRMAERAVDCQPSELVFIGNSYAHDIQPASEAGWHTIWIRRPSDVPPSGQVEQRPEGSPEPDHVVGDLVSILGLLE